MERMRAINDYQGLLSQTQDQEEEEEEEETGGDVASSRDVETAPSSPKLTQRTNATRMPAVPVGGAGRWGGSSEPLLGVDVSPSPRTRTAPLPALVLEVGLDRIASRGGATARGPRETTYRRRATTSPPSTKGRDWR